MRSSTKHAKKGPALAVLAACIGTMVAVVAKGIQLDKKEAQENKEEKEESEEN